MDLPGFKEPFAALHFIPRSLLIILVKVIAEKIYPHLVQYSVRGC